jgi:hypothetical protein
MTDTSANAAGQKAPAGGAATAAIDDKIIAAYKDMLTVQFSGTVILSGVAFVVLLGCFLFGKQVPLLPVIILAGVLGAFFSALMRLVDKAGAALITSTAQNLRGRYLLMYSLIPPVIGAIAAVVLYLVFVGKFFESPFFPKIGCLADKPCISLLDLMNYYWPSSPEDYGKALVWSFIAGFSERLVPDVLQRVAAKAEQNKQGT